MFVSQTTTLPLDITAAADRLGDLARGDTLLSASRAAYDENVTGLMRIGPAAGLSRFVRAEFGDLTYREDAASVIIRWEAAGAGGRLFPALDADIRVEAAASVTVLRLDGVYRPPLGRLGAVIDQAVLHAVADATIRRFVNRVAGLLTNPDPVAQPEAPGWPQPQPGIT